MTYLSDTQLADRFGVHRTTVRRWVHTDPSFPKPVKLSPGSTRWKLEDIEQWEIDRAAASA